MLDIRVNIRGIGKVALPTNNLDMMIDLQDPVMSRVLFDVGSSTIAANDLDVHSTWPWSDTDLVSERLAGLTFDEVNDFAWELTNCYDPEEAEQELMYALATRIEDHPLDVLISVNDGVYDNAI